ncbi:MAG: thymidylate kinase [Candidatus Methanomethylophilaceae archaeon]|nr:thymidylate kinase [Candidatus Methanomethylophilaceae archaeon]
MTWYVVDGMDGSGKSTAGNILKAHLESRGRKVLDITHPTEHRFVGRVADKFLHMEGGKFWEILAAIFYIMDVVASLFYVRRHGRMYDDIIFVRYSLAVAYVPTFMVPMTYRIVESVLPVPDIKIYVDISPDVAFERIKSRGESLELFETPDRLSKTRGKIMLISEGWNIVDNSGSEVNLEEQIVDVLESEVK